MLKSEEIDIRSLHTIEELNEVRILESRIWGDEDSIPTHQTLTAVKNGGVVLGAFYQNQLIGFQYSFPGFNGKNVYLCSHVLATDPQYRSCGVGEKLKLVQFEEARKLGYSLITWTYDPLESVNGYLNIGKLGGICSSYIPNCYGEMQDLLNNGIPSDRLLVEWYINSNKRVDTRGENVKEDEAARNSLIQWEVNKQGDPIPLVLNSQPERASGKMFVAIPKNFRIIRDKNTTLALDWRLKTREVFTYLFQHGWMITGFKKSEQPEMPVHYYILTK
jgi:predicted GNAT superfamily acetyltransferase